MPISKFMILLTVLTGSPMLAACTTVETQSFTVTGNPNVDSAYIADDADFGKYDRLLVDDMGIYFPQHVVMSDAELERIRDIFRAAFREELAGYEYTREPGPGMLRVTATLIDLRRSAGGEVPNMRRELRDAARPGSLMFLMELRDSGTDKVLGRAGDSAATPDFSAGGGTDWASVQTAAERWASLFRGFLDQNLGS